MRTRLVALALLVMGVALGTSTPATAAALEGNALDAADPELAAGHVPQTVLLVGIPAVARKTSTAFCSSEPQGDQTSGVTSGESSFLENTVRVPLDGAMYDAADEHGWIQVRRR